MDISVYSKNRREGFIFDTLGVAAGLLASFLVVLLAYAPMLKAAVLEPKKYFDFAPHIGFAQNWFDGNGSAPVHFLFHLLTGLLNNNIDNWKMSGFMVVLSAELLTSVIIYVYIYRMTHKVLTAFAAATILMIVEPLCLFILRDGYFHFGYLDPNIIHSPTLSVMKPTSLLLFMLTDLSKSGQKPQHMALMICLIVLSALAKPSYIIIMLPAIVSLYLIGYRGMSARHLFVLCLNCCMMLLLMYLLFYTDVGSRNRGGVGISWIPYRFSIGYLHMPHGHSYLTVVLKNILSVFFPLYVLIFCSKGYRKDFSFVYSWTLFVFAWVLYACFYEKRAAGAGNFGWSAYMAVFILFLSSFRVFIMRFEKNINSYCGAAILALHAVFGVAYFLKVSFNFGYA